MEIIYHIAFGIHMLCVLAILALLILQINKNPKKLNPGVVHASLTAFVAALVMVGLWDQANDEEINHIHGDADEVFPPKNIKKFIPVKGGTHIMILSKYKWLNENLPKILLEEKA